MKCLTCSETRELLAPSGVRITDAGIVEFPERLSQTRSSLRADLSFPGLRSMWLFSALVEWLPINCNRVLWIENFLIYPPEQAFVFDTLRRGAGEFRNLGEAPAHLFLSGKYEGYDSKPERDIKEDAILAAMMLLMVSFDWEGCVITDCMEEKIVIGDEFFEFYSSDEEKMRSIADLLKSYGCQIKYGNRS